MGLIRRLFGLEAPPRQRPRYARLPKPDWKAAQKRFERYTPIELAPAEPVELGPEDVVSLADWRQP